MSKLPDNEVVASFGDYRIVKTYYRWNEKEPIREELKLESKKLNSINEAYYSKAINNPNDQGLHMTENQLYQLIGELLFVQNDLLKELAK